MKEKAEKKAQQEAAKAEEKARKRQVRVEAALAAIAMVESEVAASRHADMHALHSDSFLSDANFAQTGTPRLKDVEKAFKALAKKVRGLVVKATNRLVLE